MEDYIRVSDISRYLKCPRMVYYVHKGHQPARTVNSSYVAALLIKEMAHFYAELVVSEDMDAALEELLDLSSHNLSIIYHQELNGMDEEIFHEAIETVRSWLGEIQCGIIDSIDRLGADRLVQLTASRATEPVLYSKKFRMSGSPDKLLMIDDAVSLSIIRTGRPPQAGIWKDDRIRITALAILLEEEHDCLVELGVVEYARYGIVREVTIKRADRRRVLALAGRVKKIKNSRLPQRRDDAPCEYCGYTTFCDITPTLATQFL